MRQRIQDSMAARRGPLGLAASILALHLLFLSWYDGGGGRLGGEEKQRLLAVIGAGAESGPSSETQLRAMRAFADADDGEEFVMVNLIRFHPGEEAKATNERYVQFMMPRILSRASHPIFAALPTMTLVGPEGTPVWNQVVAVRYRSRRDLLEIVASPEFQERVQDKWLSIDVTHVLPSQALIMPLGPRAIVFSMLLLAGGILHLLLRRRAWYSPP